MIGFNEKVNIEDLSPEQASEAKIRTKGVERVTESKVYMLFHHRLISKDPKTLEDEG